MGAFHLILNLKNNYMSKDKKVLIIEDEKLIRQLLRRKIQKAGFSILEAKDGEEGLKIALSEKPSLILLDLIMPKMDGITMFRKLRQDEWGKDVKVIILTNLCDCETMAAVVNEGLIKSGVGDYLIKNNWQLDDIVKKIEDKITG